MEKMTEKQRIFCSIYPYTTKYIEAFNNEYSDNNLRDEVIDYLNKVIHKFSNSSVSQSIDINICLVSNWRCIPYTLNKKSLISSKLLFLKISCEILYSF